MNTIFKIGSVSFQQLIWKVNHFHFFFSDAIETTMCIHEFIKQWLEWRSSFFFFGKNRVSDWIFRKKNRIFIGKVFWMEDSRPMNKDWWKKEDIKIFSFFCTTMRQLSTCTHFLIWMNNIHTYKERCTGRLLSHCWTDGNKQAFNKQNWRCS